MVYFLGFLICLFLLLLLFYFLQRCVLLRYGLNNIFLLLQVGTMLRHFYTLGALDLFRKFVVFLAVKLSVDPVRNFHFIHCVVLHFLRLVFFLGSAVHLYLVIEEVEHLH